MVGRKSFLFLLPLCLTSSLGKGQVFTHFVEMMGGRNRKKIYDFWATVKNLLHDYQHTGCVPFRPPKDIPHEIMISTAYGFHFYDFSILFHNTG